MEFLRLIRNQKLCKNHMLLASTFNSPLWSHKYVYLVQFTLHFVLGVTFMWEGTDGSQQPAEGQSLCSEGDRNTLLRISWNLPSNLDKDPGTVLGCTVVAHQVIHTDTERAVEAKKLRVLNKLGTRRRRTKSSRRTVVIRISKPIKTNYSREHL